MSYIQTFGGNTIQSAATSYISYSLNAASITLAWPSQFQDTQNVVYDIMDITANVGGRTATLPDARLASVGESFVFNNVGGNAIDILDNAGNVIVTVNAAQVWQLYLRTNVTAAGTWGFVPYGAGVSGVASIQAIPPASGINIVQNANTGAVTQTFTLTNDLLALENLAGTGFAVRTAANTWANRSLVQGANITITNPDGTAGNATIALNTALTGLTAITVGNINLSTNIISNTQNNTNLQFSTLGTGEIQANNNVQLRGAVALKFYNPANTFYASFTGGAVIANTAYTLPTALPTSDGQVLASTVGGVMSWLNAVSSPGATTTNAIAKYLNTTGQLANTGILIDAANNMTAITSASIQNIGIGTIAAIVGSGTNTISALNAGGGITFIPNGAGEVVSRGPLTLSPVGGVPQGAFFDDGAAANFVGLQAQTAAMAASVTYTLPNAGPTILGQHLTATVPALNASTMSWSTPAVIQAVRTVSAVAVNTANTIPRDNTIPQIGEGAEAITATITPRSTGALLIEFECPLTSANADCYLTFALFQNADANALAVSSDFAVSTSSTACFLRYIVSPPVPNVPITYRIRYGGNAGFGGTMYLLTANAGAVNYGGIAQMSLTVTELAP